MRHKNLLMAVEKHWSQPEVKQPTNYDNVNAKLKNQERGLSCFVQTVCRHFGYIWEELPSINKQANRRWITVDFRDIKISEFIKLMQGVQNWSHGASLRALYLKDLAAKTLGEQVVPQSHPLAEVWSKIVCKIGFFPFSWQEIKNRRYKFWNKTFETPAK